MLSAQLFFDLSNFAHPTLFQEDQQVWNSLNLLKDYMNRYDYPNLDHPQFRSGVPLTETLVLYKGELKTTENIELIFGDTCKGGLTVKEDDQILEGASVIMAGSILVGEQIEIGSSCLIESGAMVKSPTIIGDCCEVRQGSYIRGYCLTGNRCVIGHATEIKHSIMLDDAKAGHFNYLGDSILGNNTNLGAGTKLANFRFLPGNVGVQYEGKKVDTGLRKLGLILGDNSQTGCNSVTSPGTVMGKRCLIMPNTTTRAGYFPNNSRI